MDKTKKIRVGFDLDGVIIDKPFFMPKRLIEWLYRSHDKSQHKYRVPHWKLEILIRKLSHHWGLRLPLFKNLSLVKKIAQNTQVDAYVISGRYNFLQNRTNQWIKIHRLNKIFKKIYINNKNQQPHLFKEQMLKKLRLDYFFDDDPIVIKHLKKTCRFSNCQQVTKQRNSPLINFEINNEE